MFSRGCLSAVLVVVLGGGLRAEDSSGFEYTPLDDFEDVSAWSPGDPQKDLARRDWAVAAGQEFVHGGDQSIAFMIRVNWTERPGEKYAKGWPMMRRTFAEPQDWSRYDYVEFWLYPKTDLSLRQSTVLRVGFPWKGMDVRQPWHTIEPVEPNRWQRVRVPLVMEADWAHVTGISFYVAEGWYRDGDAVDFYIDDMRLARRTVPVISSASATARTFPRGEALDVRLKIAGPTEGARVRCRIADTPLEFTQALDEKETRLEFPTKGLEAGGHHAVVELVDASGKVLDSRRQCFRSLQPGKRSYLKLITFYTGPVAKATEEKFQVLNDSAYAGVAIPLLGSYDTAPVPPYASFGPQAAMLRRVLTIDPWPWVTLNRFIGARPDGGGHASSHADDVEYFRRVPGMDLDGQAGNRADMLTLWRYAVRMAKEWKSPGIMIDLEAYNNYRAYNTAWVAAEREEDIDTVIEQCEEVGEDLARIIEEEYPECVVWSLFSRLERSVPVAGREGEIFTTPSYVTLGLLEYAKAHGVPLKYICGGETTPGYCNRSVDALRQKIADRDRAMAPYLEQFPDHLFLGGTISPFHDYSITTAFIESGYQGSDFETIEDFEPMFKSLFDAYDYVWIYASSAAKTLPYRAENSQRYSAVLGRALDASASE